MTAERVPALEPTNWTPHFERKMEAQLDKHERRIERLGVLLWSQSQNAFHVELVQDMMRSNRKAYSDDRQMDYVPIFFGDRGSCLDLAEKLRNTLRQRAEAPQRRLSA